MLSGAFIVFSALLFSACQSPKEKALKNIQELENNDSSFNPVLMKNLKDAYLDFVNKYPDDANSPEYLFKAGQRSNVLNQPTEAIQLFDKLMQQYPKSSYCEEALFLSGYTFENNLHDFEKARAAYESFLKKYPKSDLADDARLSLDNLGRSPEEILENIKKESQ